MHAYWERRRVAALEDRGSPEVVQGFVVLGLLHRAHHCGLWVLFSAALSSVAGISHLGFTCSSPQSSVCSVVPLVVLNITESDGCPDLSPAPKCTSVDVPRWAVVLQLCVSAFAAVASGVELYETFPGAGLGPFHPALAVTDTESPAPVLVSSCPSCAGVESWWSVSPRRPVVPDDRLHSDSDHCTCSASARLAFLTLTRCLVFLGRDHLFLRSHSVHFFSLQTCSCFAFKPPVSLILLL